MNIRLTAILLTSFFLIGAFPIFSLQPSGAASAGITAGFVAGTDNLYHAAVLVAIGIVSAWGGGEVALALPLAVLLMLCAGALTQLEVYHFKALSYFLLGDVILFALSVSIIRRKIFLLAVPPAAIWCYFTGGGFMRAIPAVATPLFFLMGVVVCSAMILAIGLAFGATLVGGMGYRRR